MTPRGLWAVLLFFYVQCQSEVRPEATLEALKRGRAAGMTTIFNPAPAKADLPDR